MNTPILRCLHLKERRGQKSTLLHNTHAKDEADWTVKNCMEACGRTVYIRMHMIITTCSTQRVTNTRIHCFKLPYTGYP